MTAVRSVTLVAVVLSLTCPRSVQAQSAEPLEDLAWIGGAWVAESSGERLEEWWSAPVGNSMVGHFRWIRDGGLWLTEMLSITAEAGEVFFRLRHFSAEMTAWEEKNDPFRYRLSERGARRAAFTITEPRAGRPTRITFEALAGDSLLVRLEGEEDGRPTAQNFRYGRAR